MSLAVVSVALLPPFPGQAAPDKTDYPPNGSARPDHDFALNPYGPFEQRPGQQKPNPRHWLGPIPSGATSRPGCCTGRVPLAVGWRPHCHGDGTGGRHLFRLFRGRFDLVVMRIVEIFICFPSFLLLLTDVDARDYKFEQSILVVIAVIGLTD